MNDHRFKNALRLPMIMCLSRFSPYYIITEYPKSGGTWLCKMLSDLLQVDFPSFDKLPKVLSPSILQGHYLWLPGMKNVVVVTRDGRDVMVSWYHHCLFHNDKTNHLLVDRNRERVSFNDYENIERNMPAFLRYVFEEQKYPRFTWSKFVRNWMNREGVAYVKYEDLLSNPHEELKRISCLFGFKDIPYQNIEDMVFNYSFKNMSGRSSGEENKSSFLRKGIAGDWVNYFNEEARNIFLYYAGEELRLLGYEENNNWAQK